MSDEETNVQPVTDGEPPQPPADTTEVVSPEGSGVETPEAEISEEEREWWERTFPTQEKANEAHEELNRAFHAKSQENAGLRRIVEELKGGNQQNNRVETPASASTRLSSIDAIKAGILERFGEEDGKPFLELIELVVAPLQQDKTAREQATVEEVNHEFDNIMVEFGRTHPEVAKIEALATLVQQEVDRELFPYGGLRNFIGRVNSGKANKSEVMWYKGVLDHAYENVKAIKMLGLSPKKQPTAPDVLAAAAASVPNATTTTPLPGTGRQPYHVARGNIQKQRYPGK